MRTEHVTTPFGRRPMSLDMLAGQLRSRAVEPAKSVDKWKLYRALCGARNRLGITDRALALLNALLTFYPHNELCAEHGLVVFPSNAQLSLRANGMAESTIRRHLAVLVEAGLLARKDSANGKRFARRDGQGIVDEAYGFSLAPLVSRWEEIEILAAEVTAERMRLQRLKERISICRRDIAKLIEMALENGASGDWEAIHLSFRTILLRMPRNPDSTIAASVLKEIEELREEIVNHLEIQSNIETKSASPGQIERHIQNSNTESIPELEPLFEKDQGRTVETIRNGRENTPKAYPLAMVLSACPDVTDYGPGGAIGSWRDLMSAAIVVRSVLGVSPSAYEAACAAMGPEVAASVMSCILERAGHINSAGGYLRDLTRKAEAGAFSLGPMLMALLRTRSEPAKRAS